MICKYALLYFTLITLGGVSSKSSNNMSNQRSTIWAINAVDYLRNITCDHIFYNALALCQKAKGTAVDRMAVFSAFSAKGGKLLAVLPDGPLGRSNEHDGVLVLDPFPEASFGHLVFVYFVEHFKSISARNRNQCENSGGVFIDSYNDCLRLALRDGCHRSQKHKRRRINGAQRCEIDSLPSVYEIGNALSESEGGEVIASGQKLKCRNVAGFVPCASPSGNNAVVPALYGSVCEDDETRRECASRLEPQLNNVRCRLFETCDHAVVIHGGWNRLTLKDSDLVTLQETRTMLAFNGYSDENVRTFYANGEIHLPGISTHNLYPASAKSLLRQHVQNVCHQSHCVDTLAVFIKAPSMQDGALLLWDLDGSGIASEDEMYQPSEFVADISNCLAKQVFIVADFSYSGRLIEVFRNAKSKLKNVALVTSGNEFEVSWGSELTKLWFMQNRRTQCFKKIVEIGRESVANFNPLLFEGKESSSDSGTTLCGAPCNVVPPFTEIELKEKYFGCQNVPSLTWFRRAANLDRAEPPLATEKSVNFLAQPSSNVTQLNNLSSRQRRRRSTKL